VGIPKGQRAVARPRRRWEGNIKWVFRKWSGETWTGLLWLRIGTGGGRF
jgi:hypothetical protein